MYLERIFKLHKQFHGWDQAHLKQLVADLSNLCSGWGKKEISALPLVLCTYLVYNTVVRLCQFFGCGGK
jgi:hypothetical protein